MSTNATKKILVAFATSEGSTRMIAKRIADGIVEISRSCEVETTLYDVSVYPYDPIDVAKFDLVIIGSAIHNQNWLKEAVSFLEQNPEMKLAYAFSVCSVGERTSFLGETVSNWARSRRQFPAAITNRVDSMKHHFFAGIANDSWGIIGNIFVWLTWGSMGDHISWEEVDDWAAQLAKDISL
jgi:menaquinone-dependent protoporphyrinogen oxidase